MKRSGSRFILHSVPNATRGWTMGTVIRRRSCWPAANAGKRRGRGKCLRLSLEGEQKGTYQRMFFTWTPVHHQDHCENKDHETRWPDPRSFFLLPMLRVVVEKYVLKKQIRCRLHPPSPRPPLKKSCNKAGNSNRVSIWSWSRQFRHHARRDGGKGFPRSYTS